MAGKLNARIVASITLSGRHTPGRHTDADGLHLHVRPDGAAAWVLRFRLHGRQRDLGLGGYPLIGLAEARHLSREAKTLVARGVDPGLERRAARMSATQAAAPGQSFRAVVEALIEARQAGWRSEKHALQWKATLSLHAYPIIGHQPVSAIDTSSVLRVLQPIWNKTPETASRIRGRIEAVLDFARARGWRSGDNPARWRGHLAEVLPSPRKVSPVEHQPALPWRDVPAFMQALSRRPSVTSLAIRFAILTAARTGEVRGMLWKELNFESETWTVPSQRMKAGRIHRVPLSFSALSIISELRALRLEGCCPDDRLVFPGAREGRPLSDMALSMLVRGMSIDSSDPDALPRWQDADGRAIVPHGFRTSFRGWTRAMGWADHLGEIALAHVDKDRVRAAYARDDLLDERRAMMRAWGSFCVAQSFAEAASEAPSTAQ